MHDMQTQTTVTVGVGPVRPAEVVAVARAGARVQLSSDALAAIDAGRHTIDALAQDDRPH
jgi:histidine ammonia-lyase